MSEQSPNDMFYAGVYWVWATPGLGLRVATPSECAAEIIRLRALVAPTPPAQDATHGAGARRTWDGDGERREGAGGASKRQEGRIAFEAGLGLDANPYSFLDGRWDWSTGWFKAREVALERWKSANDAGGAFRAERTL